MTTEAKVAGHYTRGRLEETILRAMTQMGKDTAHLASTDLASIDEFHVGGLEATQAMGAHMDLRPGLRLLDVGSGIGGPARYFAAEHRCHVTGIDLTEEFVQVAKSLTQRVKLDHAVEFRTASALQLPFSNETFDRAYMIHVGMNIPDKSGVYREVRRVLKSGGVFALFEIMRGGANGAIRYPVPWALSEETSFVSGAADYRKMLEQAGFRLVQERIRREFAIEFMKRALARMAPGTPPVLGAQLLLGERTSEMLNNTLTMIQEGVLEPVELYAQAAA